MAAVAMDTTDQAAAAKVRGLTALAAMRARRAQNLEPLGSDPRLPLGHVAPESEQPPEEEGCIVDEGGIWTEQGERIQRKDPLLKRALLSSGVKWDQILQLPDSVFAAQMSGQPVLPESIERRKAAYEELRHEAIQLVLDELRKLRKVAGRNVPRPTSSVEETQSAEDLRQAGPLDPVAKAKAEAALMMKAERDRQEKLMASREAKAARELEKVRSAELLQEEKLAEQERVDKLMKAKQREQLAQIDKRRQEQQLWRVHRAKQQEYEEELRLDLAHKAAIERAEREQKLKLREEEKREARQMQRLAFAHKHKQKLIRIAAEARRKEEAMVVLGDQTKAKLAASDRTRQIKREEEFARRAAESSMRQQMQEERRRAKQLADKRAQEERREEIEAKLRAGDERLERRQQQQLADMAARRAATIEREEERQHNVAYAQWLREYAAGEQTSVAELKEQRIAAAARSKVEKNIIRAESSRLNFQTKQVRVQRKKSAMEFERKVAEERSDAKMAKADALIEAKRNLNEERRKLAVDFQFKQQVLRRDATKTASWSTQSHLESLYSLALRPTPT